MKNLLLMRHAKSDWSDYSLSDFERPLNKRGLNDAPLMGKQILKHNKNIDLIISSPAKRAKTTAELVAKTVDYQKDIQFEQTFYGGSEDDIEVILTQTEKTQNVVLMVSHNPTIEMLIYSFLKKKQEIIMPTAAIASLLFDVDDWAKIEASKAKLEWLIVPKQFK